MNDWMNRSHYIVMNFWSDDMDWNSCMMNDWSNMVDRVYVMHWDFVVDYRSDDVDWNLGMMHWSYYLSER